MTCPKAVILLGSAAVLGLLAAPATAATARVTNNDDSGPGSFRRAVRLANADPSITSIQFTRDLGTILLERPIKYTGPQSLSIDGRDTEVSSIAEGSFDLFVADGGGDLTLKDLTFRDGDSGVVVEVPPDATGGTVVSLLDVTIADNLRFGLEINEDDPTDEEPFAASINLMVVSSHFTGNGLLDTMDEDEGDVDAVRVNERGDGVITAVVIGSDFTDNGADGFELDEEGLGDATLTAVQSTFDDNGLTRPGGDDGLDIDESEDGSILLNVAGSRFNRSTDDGIGLDESGDGDLHLSLVQVEASENADSGVSADEGQAGDFEVDFVLVSADENGDDGADLEEDLPSEDDPDPADNAGDFEGRAVGSSFSSNDDNGISVTQNLPGTGTLLLQGVTLDDNDGGACNTTNVVVTPPCP